MEEEIAAFARVNGVYSMRKPFIKSTSGFDAPLLHIDTNRYLWLDRDETSGELMCCVIIKVGNQFYSETGTWRKPTEEEIAQFAALRMENGR